MRAISELMTRTLTYKIEPAVIKISNRRLTTYIGFNQEETQKQQDIVINGSIVYESNIANESDDENDALNYKTITKKIIKHVESQKFRLLEKLTSDLIKITMQSPLVQQATFTVDKPNALHFSDSVSITLSASRK